MAQSWPSKDATADEILAYQKGATNKFGSVRNQQMVGWENYRLYPAGYQWLGWGAGSDPINEPFPEPMSAGDAGNMPMPVIQAVAPILTGEVARLCTSAANPAIVPNERTTRVHRSARLSEQVLDDILKEEKWVDLKQQDRRNALQYGTGLIMTGLELDFDDLENVPLDVFACGCGWNVSEKSAEEIGNGALEFKGEKAAGMHQNGIGQRISSVGDSEVVMRLAACPECGGELKKRMSTEADGGVDSFGDELFEDAPNHKAFIRCYSVYDFFPTGNGRMKHGFLPEYTIESIVSLEWLLKRHKHAVDVKPLTMAGMMDSVRWHPSGVESGGIYGFGGLSLNDRPRWCVYRITVREPFKNEDGEAEPMGRVLISANDTVLYNGDLMFKHKETGRKIHRYKLHIGRATTENDSCYGVGLVSQLIGMQDAVNNMVSMAEYNMHTFGNPRMMVNSATNIEYLGTGAGKNQSDVMQWTGDVEPSPIQGVGTHPDAFKLIDLNLERMERAALQSDISRGQAPPGVSAASAMKYLGDQAGAAKKPLEERFAERDAGIFEHTLELVNATYDTPRLLKAGDRGDERTQDSYTSMDLMWQLDVKVEVKPSYNTEVFEREATKEMLASHLLPMNTPLDMYKITKAMGAAEEVNAASAQQVECAENEWLDFMFGRPPVAPVVKTKYDDHAIHEWQHLRDLNSADGSSLRRFWSLVQVATEDWTKQLEALAQAEIAAETAVPPQIVTGPTGQTDPIATKASVEAWQFGQQAKEIVAAQPKNIEQRIFQIMAQLLAQDQKYLTLDEESAKDCIMLVRYLSHIEAHRYQLAQMMAPPPQPAPTPTAIPAAAPANPYN